MKHRYEVDVKVSAKVEIDDEVFTSERMREFDESIYPLGSLKEHAAHIAYQLVRRGYQNSFRVFLEGYGDLEKSGIVADADDTDIDYVRELS